MFINHTTIFDNKDWAMKISNFLKAIVSPSTNYELSKLSIHLLEDIGANTAYGSTRTIRTPAEIGVRLV